MSTRGPDGPAPGPGGSGRDAARSGGFGSGEFSGASAPGADEDSVTGAASGGGRHLRAVPDPVEQHDPEGFDVASRVAHRLSGLLPPARLGPGRGGRRRRRVTGEQRSGPRPDARDPQPLGAAVDELIAARGWRRQIGLRLVVQRWDELVGPSNARQLPRRSPRRPRRVEHLGQCPARDRPAARRGAQPSPRRRCRHPRRRPGPERPQLAPWSPLGAGARAPGHLRVVPVPVLSARSGIPRSRAHGGLPPAASSSPPHVCVPASNMSRVPART